MKDSNTLTREQKQQPPYSGIMRTALAHPETLRQFAGTSAYGSAFSVYLVVGSEAWRKAKSMVGSHFFVMLPPDAPDDDPKQYDWSLLAGHDPIIAIVAGDPLSNEQYKDLAAALMRDGVTRFVRPRGDGPAVRHLSKEVVECLAS